MIYRVSEKTFRLGDLALLYQAFYQGQSVARSLVSDLGGRLPEWHVFEKPV